MIGCAHECVRLTPIGSNNTYGCKINRRRLPRGNGGEYPRRITPHTTPLYGELTLSHKFAHLFLGKSSKTAVNRYALFDYSMHEPNRLSTGTLLQTQLWESTALPRLATWVKGPYFEGNERGREERREGEGGREGRGRTQFVLCLLEEIENRAPLVKFKPF